jgi:hypothetical protein
VVFPNSGAKAATANASPATNSKPPSATNSPPSTATAPSSGRRFDAASAKAQQARPALEDQRRALADETRRAERALVRYYTAFEAGNIDAARFEKRVCALETRLDALREQDAELAQQLAPQGATSPDAAELTAVADNLEATIATAEPRQAKALLRLLIKDLRVNARSEILPTYRVITPAVCALPSSVEPTGLEPVTFGVPRRRSPS